jgi:glutamine synthetase
MMDNEILTTLEDQGIRFVRLIWCDNANVIRAKAIHISALPQRMEGGVGLSAAQQAVSVMADAVALDSGLGPVGEVWLRPDWATLRCLPYAPGHARVMGDMVANNQPWPWCTRQFLKRMVQRLAEAGFTLKAAFEPEFYLVRVEGDRILPTDSSGFAATLAMDKHQSVIDAIAVALIDQDVAVEQYYPESGPGQQELSVRYTDALGAADQHIIYRETVKAIAHQQGLVASFVPKLFEGVSGSGCHLHVSLWQGDRNLTHNGNGDLSPVARAFMAGVLHHLPGLMAITTPSTNSYRRLQPQCWSGAYRVWGMDNREAALRVPSNPTRPSPTHLEMKTVDGAANPYLALGAIIAAGLDGIQQQLPLPSPINCDPATLSEAEQAAQGIDRLPPSLSEAIDALANDPVLRDALGTDLATTLLAIRQTEWQAMKDFNLEEEVKLLLERY